MGGERGWGEVGRGGGKDEEGGVAGGGGGGGEEKGGALCLWDMCEVRMGR